MRALESGEGAPLERLGALLEAAMEDKPDTMLQSLNVEVIYRVHDIDSWRDILSWRAESLMRCSDNVFSNNACPRVGVPCGRRCV